MKRNFKWLISIAAALALVCAFALAGCGSSEPAEEPAGEPAEAVELQVFAANSLSKAMDEAQALYTEQTGVTFADTQYLSSGDLKSELAAGAYADLVISASNAKMDGMEEDGTIDPETRFVLFKNDLVMVTAEGNDSITEITLDDIATGNYTVGIGDDSVPAGQYANQSLSTVGCFNDPEGKVGAESKGVSGDAGDAAAYAGTPIEGKYTLADSVGNVCSLAETGEVDIAFVYTSDVQRFTGVKIVGTIPADVHKNIVYPAAICTGSNNVEAAQAFLDWCMTDPGAAEIWQKWAFELAG